MLRPLGSNGPEPLAPRSSVAESTDTDGQIEASDS